MSCIREELEDLERLTLSPYAALSVRSKGRDRYEEPDDIRPCYERDRDRILHCKSFRRLKHKTQVFIAPEGDHYRTRLTHTLEVSQIARTFGKALRLNEDLIEAIALGHDLGHTPFGHSGERVLNTLCHNGFSHVEQSVRVVEVLEKGGRGLNLTKEVRDGILNHRTSGHPQTLEGQAVRFADKIAYINHDTDDSLRAGLICESEIPKEITDVLGHSVKERLNNLIHDVIYSSNGRNELRMSPTTEKAMQSLRQWMFDHVYIGGEAKKEEVKVNRMIRLLFNYYMENPYSMTGEYVTMLENNLASIATDDPDKERKTLLAHERSVCDYIAGMTDDYCIYKFKEYFVPIGWQKY
ncbi:deoxyguanosinetriphosphate triphosphohydrolase [Oribacterium sp. WCC10]|uniref:deoxyguanosinetriphosphate triphosphohydrolase n=1 Tax=Oribacterium sp. WCC10 TaxID=1855343 RepID=UPI0008F34114|nr:deoxyguanosinetriphosphate triphosphohydrolase [Oribacterium sp. WCC10]SFG41584.1 dGTPase [Oribacterium sp. WCC10]